MIDIRQDLPEIPDPPRQERREWTMKRGSAIHSLWWHWSNECLPLRPWRLYCWLYGHADDSYGKCVVCACALAAKGPKP